MSSKVIELGPDRFEIPNHWKFEEVSNIMEIERGKSFPRRMEAEEGIPYLHYGDIHSSKKNYIDLSSEIKEIPKIAIEINEIDEKYLLKTGDIVLADASEDYEDLCKSVTIFNEDNLPFIAGLHTLIARSEDYDPNYARYLFSIEFVKRQIMRYGTGSTVIGMTKTTFKDVKIPVPPLPEQRKIAAILSSVDRAIEATQQVIAKTERLKKGMMQKLFSEGIESREKQSTPFGKYPREWDFRELGTLTSTKQRTGIYKKNDGLDLEDGSKFFIIKMGEHFAHEIFDAKPSDIIYLSNKEREKYSLKKGDLLFARRSIVMEGAGKPMLISNKQNFDITFESSLIRLRFDDNLINPKFILYFFLSYQGKRQMRRIVRQLSVSGISGSDLIKLKVPVPDKNEQDRIVTIISSYDKFLENCDYEQTKLQKLKKSLMQQLLTGKIRVKTN